MTLPEIDGLTLTKTDAIVSLTVLFAALTLLLVELTLEAWAVMLLAGALYSHALAVPPIAFGTSVLVALSLRVAGLLLFSRSAASRVKVER